MYGEDTNLLEVAKHHILREYIEAREWEVVEVKMYEDFHVSKCYLHVIYTIN